MVGANLLETRIPDAHFVFDAVAAGARLVVVDPVNSSTATKADNWLNIKAGTDAAFALAMAATIVEEDLADLEFMRTYTDAPLLVRSDTGKRLLASDLDASIDPADPTARRYVVWDLASNTPAVIPIDRLGIPAGVEAALDGEFTVELTDGTTVTVTPGFTHVQAELARFTPELTEEITGLDPDLVRRVARAYAGTDPAAILMGAGANHWYHGDLTGRARHARNPPGRTTGTRQRPGESVAGGTPGDLTGSRVPGRRLATAQRRRSKNSVSRAAHSSARTPATTSDVWLSRLSTATL